MPGYATSALRKRGRETVRSVQHVASSRDDAKVDGSDEKRMSPHGRSYPDRTASPSCPLGNAFRVYDARTHVRLREGSKNSSVTPDVYLIFLAGGSRTCFFTP